MADSETPEPSPLHVVMVRLNQQRGHSGTPEHSGTPQGSPFAAIAAVDF